MKRLNASHPSCIINDRSANQNVSRSVSDVCFTVVRMASTQKNRKFVENGKNAAPAKKARYVCFCGLKKIAKCHYFDFLFLVVTNSSPVTEGLRDSDVKSVQKPYLAFVYLLPSVL